MGAFDASPFSHFQGICFEFEGDTGNPAGGGVLGLVANKKVGDDRKNDRFLSIEAPVAAFLVVGFVNS